MESEKISERTQIAHERSVKECKAPDSGLPLTVSQVEIADEALTRCVTRREE